MYELAGVEKRYGDGGAAIAALAGIDLGVAEGEMLSVVGPSGSGKSTMLQLLGALDVPTAGRVTFDGRDLGDLGDRDLTAIRRDDLGFIFQQFNLVPTLTAAENVETALVPRRVPASERRERVRAALDDVGLAGRVDHLPSQLSGGEQQRVAIARALVGDPRVLLADEPTGNLDSATGGEIMTRLRDLHASRGYTIVLVTHDVDRARQMPRVVEMRDGRIVRDTAA